MLLLSTTDLSLSPGETSGFHYRVVGEPRRCPAAALASQGGREEGARTAVAKPPWRFDWTRPFLGRHVPNSLWRLVPVGGGLLTASHKKKQKHRTMYPLKLLKFARGVLQITILVNEACTLATRRSGTCVMAEIGVRRCRRFSTNCN